MARKKKKEMFCLVSQYIISFLSFVTSREAVFGAIVKSSRRFSLRHLKPTPGSLSATSAFLLRGRIGSGPPTSLKCEEAEPAVSNQPSASEVLEGPQEAL